MISYTGTVTEEEIKIRGLRISNQETKLYRRATEIILFVPYLFSIAGKSSITYYWDPTWDDEIYEIEAYDCRVNQFVKRVVQCRPGSTRGIVGARFIGKVADPKETK